jgi:hypothetical protein
MVSTIVAHTTPRGKFDFALCQRAFMYIYTFLANSVQIKCQVPLKRKISQIWKKWFKKNLNSNHSRWFILNFIEIGGLLVLEKIFVTKHVYLLFRYYLPLEKSNALISTNLNLLHPRNIYAKLGLNWPSGSRENVEIWKVYRQIGNG